MSPDSSDKYGKRPGRKSGCAKLAKRKTAYSEKLSLGCINSQLSKHRVHGLRRLTPRRPEVKHHNVLRLRRLVQLLPRFQIPHGPRHVSQLRPSFPPPPKPLQTLLRIGNLPNPGALQPPYHFPPTLKITQINTMNKGSRTLPRPSNSEKLPKKLPHKPRETQKTTHGQTNATNSDPQTLTSPRARKTHSNPPKPTHKNPRHDLQAHNNNQFRKQRTHPSPPSNPKPRHTRFQIAAQRENRVGER